MSGLNIEKPSFEEIQNGRAHQRHLQSSSSSIDWVQQSKVTPVRNQGGCGSCWAFASSAAMESAYLIDGVETSLSTHVSEQQQVDCVYDRSGCNGGFMTKSFSRAIDHGFKPAKRYPYVGYYQGCTKANGRYKLSSYRYLYLPTCDTVKAELQRQPLSVTVDASNWNLITDDIFPYEATTWGDLNHAVLLTGYQENAGYPYWVIKNSWGPYWGDRGYAKLAYGPDGNNCGICMAVVYPTV